MNTLIRELLKQASKLANTDDNKDFDRNFGIIVAEKFAALIVRECAKVADIADENKCEWIGGNILTHFGVDEQEKVAPKLRCSVCGTTENVMYMGGYQPYLCDSVDCIPF